MGIFDIFKWRKVVWRNRKGKIECPGDSCKKKCDDSCPIWLHKKAVSLLQQGEFAKSTHELVKIVEMARDYKEAWANLGLAYYRLGSSSAIYSYKKAYRLDKKYDVAIKGLIYSYMSKDEFKSSMRYCEKLEAICGKEKAEEVRNDAIKGCIYSHINRDKFESSMKYCEKLEAIYGKEEAEEVRYDAIKGRIYSHMDRDDFETAMKYCDRLENICGKEKADEVRKIVKRNIRPRLNPPIMIDKTMAHASEKVKMINEFAINKYMVRLCGNLTFKHDLIRVAQRICTNVYKEMMKLDCYDKPIYLLAWGAYAGIGAAHFWNVNPDSVSLERITETLLGPRGANEMDEFVLDSIGIGYDTQGGKLLSDMIYDVAGWFVKEYLQNLKLDGKYNRFRDEDPVQRLYEATCAMYIFGVEYQLEHMR